MDVLRDNAKVSLRSKPKLIGVRGGFQAKLASPRGGPSSKISIYIYTCRDKGDRKARRRVRVEESKESKEKRRSQNH